MAIFSIGLTLHSFLRFAHFLSWHDALYKTSDAYYLCTTIIIICLSLYLLLSIFGLLLYPKSMVAHMEDITLQP